MYEGYVILCYMIIKRRNLVGWGKKNVLLGYIVLYV